MTDAARMLQPLLAEEVTAVEGRGRAARAQDDKPKPIVPVPDDAPPMQYRHPKHGKPSKDWEYHDADGLVVGYTLRWDFTGKDGKLDKEIRPICYCELGDGRRAWRAVGIRSSANSSAQRWIPSAVRPPTWYRKLLPS